MDIYAFQRTNNRKQREKQIMAISSSILDHRFITFVSNHRMVRKTLSGIFFRVIWILFDLQTHSHLLFRLRRFLRSFLFALSSAHTSSHLRKMLRSMLLWLECCWRPGYGRERAKQLLPENHEAQLFLRCCARGDYRNKCHHAPAGKIKWNLHEWIALFMMKRDKFKYYCMLQLYLDSSYTKLNEDDSFGDQSGRK